MEKGKGGEETYRRSLWTRILMLTLLPLGLLISFSNPETSQPSWWSWDRVSRTMSRTSSRFSMRAAPRVEEQAHDWGQPQLRSTPEVNGTTREEARASSWGTLAPNWTMVGGWGPAVEMVKSLSRANLLRLNSLARIMGVQQRSVP